MSGFVAWSAGSPHQRANGSVSVVGWFLRGFWVDQLLGFAAKEFKFHDVGWGHVGPFHSRRLLGTRSAAQCQGLPQRRARLRGMTQAGMSHRQHQPIEGFRAPAPTPRVRLLGTLDRQIEFTIPVVREAQRVEIPGALPSLHGSPRPLDNLARGDNRAWADRQSARADSIRPLFAKLLIGG